MGCPTTTCTTHFAFNQPSAGLGGSILIRGQSDLKKTIDDYLERGKGGQVHLLGHDSAEGTQACNLALAGTPLFDPRNHSHSPSLATLTPLLAAVQALP